MLHFKLAHIASVEMRDMTGMGRNPTPPVLVCVVETAGISVEEDGETWSTRQVNTITIAKLRESGGFLQWGMEFHKTLQFPFSRQTPHHFPTSFLGTKNSDV